MFYKNIKIIQYVYLFSETDELCLRGGISGGLLNSIGNENNNL